MIIPPSTPVPMARWLFMLPLKAVASGTTHRMKASVEASHCRIMQISGSGGRFARCRDPQCRQPYSVVRSPSISWNESGSASRDIGMTYVGTMHNAR